MALRPHPLGVQPLGVALASGGRGGCRAAGLGALAALTDELLLEVLELLDARSLCALARASRALLCFAYAEELWKGLTLRTHGGRYRWRGSWRATYRAHNSNGPPAPALSVRVSDLYSDVLFQPHLCAWAPLQPHWLEVESVPRVEQLTVQAFQERFERPNRPCLITDVVPTWSASGRWSAAHFRDRHGDVPVHVGGYSMRMADYMEYAEGAAGEDQPLYLFDKAILSLAAPLGGDYQVPAYFSEDLFAVLGDSARPDWRWLIVGPARSGSSFHKDPNATSAWNAVVAGAKRWLLFPPHVQPPGVQASPDGASVVQPVSLIEWFLNFYDAARAAEHATHPPLQPGELLFVPSGWWHLALNLEPATIAVTQNYVSEANLPKVLAHLRSANGELISGCADEERPTMYGRFVAALEEQRPAVMARMREREAEVAARKRLRGEEGLGAAFKAAAAAAPFSFNFT